MRVDVLGVEPLRRTQKLALAAEILVIYCRVRWDLKRLGLSRTVERARAHTAPAPAGRAARLAPITGIRLGGAVIRTLHPLPTNSRCLMRSLVLTAVLARRGIESNLVIGVRPGSNFEAHAWVEVTDIPLLPAGERWSRLLQA